MIAEWTSNCADCGEPFFFMRTARVCRVTTMSSVGGNIESASRILHTSLSRFRSRIPLASSTTARVRIRSRHLEHLRRRIGSHREFLPPAGYLELLL
jgi:hypothetical protein